MMSLLGLAVLALAVVSWLAACEMDKYAQELRREQARRRREISRLRRQLRG